MTSSGSNTESELLALEELQRLSGTFGPVLEILLKELLQDYTRKRPRNEDNEGETEKDQKHDLKSYGRKFCRVGVAGFEKIQHLVEFGLKLEAEEPNSGIEEEEEESEFAKELRTMPGKRKAVSWTILTETIPGFKEKMVAMAKERVLRRAFCKRIQRGVKDARSDDTSRLRYHLPDWINLDLSPLYPPIYDRNESKAQRGWNHPTFAHYLTPAEWPSNEVTWAEIRHGTKNASAQRWPRFMYPNGHIFDENDEEDKLFYGHLLLQATKCLFMGPSAATKGPGYGKGKNNVALIIGMTKVTPRMLAYVAVQVHYTLSDVDKWNNEDRGFDKELFFWNIVGFFKNGEGQGVLDYFTGQLFGSLDSTLARGNNEHEMSAEDRMDAERAVKRARLIASSPTAATVAATSHTPN